MASSQTHSSGALEAQITSHELVPEESRLLWSGVQRQLLEHYCPPALVLDMGLQVHFAQGAVADFVEPVTEEQPSPTRRFLRKELREPLHWMLANLVAALGAPVKVEQGTDEARQGTSASGEVFDAVTLAAPKGAPLLPSDGVTLQSSGGNRFEARQLIVLSCPIRTVQVVVRPLPKLDGRPVLFLVCMEPVARFSADDSVRPYRTLETPVVPSIPESDIQHVADRSKLPALMQGQTTSPADAVGTVLNPREISSDPSWVATLRSLDISTPMEGLEWNPGSTESLLQFIVDSSPDMIFVKDRQHRLQFVNESFARNVGQPVGFLIGKTDLDIGLPEKLVLGDPESGWPGYWAHDSHVLSTGEVINVPADPVLVTGVIRTFHTIKMPVRNSAGQIIGLLGYARDITERTEAEQQTRETAIRLRAILEGVVDGVLTLDETDRIETFNLAAERIFGYTAAEVTGQSLSLLVPGGRADWEDAQGHRARETAPLTAGRELVGRRKNGDLFPLELALSESHLPNRRLVTGIVRDITRRKESERELTRARDQAEQASRAKSDFLSQMSHELRTPLNAILGFAQLMEADRSQPLNVRQRENNQQVLKAGWHLLELINEILDLAKIEAGKVELSMETVDVHEIVSLCEEMVLPLASQRGVRLVSALPPDVRILVWSDQTRLRQMLLNLLSNAVKYNRPGGSVLVTAQLVGTRRVRISVRDTGMGISPEDLGRLFQPFVRLGNAQQRDDGTGIGLLITRRLAELMGGAVGVDSTVGVGSTFWIELETGREPAREGEHAEHETALDHTRRSHARAPVALYVEDNQANYELLRQLLEQYTPLKLIRASDGSSGLALARVHLPDLILLDIGLPDMDGFEVLRRLQAEPDTCNIPVFALSANALPADVSRGLAAGFRHYFTKPLQLNLFLKELSRLLKARDGEADMV